MWFIIIFSAILVIRPLLTSTGHKLKLIAGYPTKEEQKPTYAPNDSWVELSGRKYKSHADVGVRAASRKMGRSDSEVEILPQPGQITVTKDFTVESIGKGM